MSKRIIRKRTIRFIEIEETVEEVVEEKPKLKKTIDHYLLWFDNGPGKQDGLGMD